MAPLTRLENKIGWLAIGNLPIYIVAAQGLVYIWSLINPNDLHLLALDPLAVLYRHEYWRFLTFPFMTEPMNPIFAFFFLFFQYYCATTLESEWGSFPFTIFYLLGVIGTMIATFITYYLGSPFIGGAYFVNLTVFLATAVLYPDFTILLFFIIPVKVKWVAVVTWLYLLYQFIFSNFEYRLVIVFSLANYFLFFGKTHYQHLKSAYENFQHKRRFKNWSGGPS